MFFILSSSLSLVSILWRRCKAFSLKFWINAARSIMAYREMLYKIKSLWISNPLVHAKGFERSFKGASQSIFRVHKVFPRFQSWFKLGNDMSKKKLHYGVRLRVDQLKYLKEVQNPSEWIRKAVDEKRKREEKRKIKSKWLHKVSCSTLPDYGLQAPLCVCQFYRGGKPICLTF